MTPPPLAADTHPPTELARVEFTALTGERVERIAPISQGWGHLSWTVRTTSGRYLIKTGIRRPQQADLYRQVAAQQIAAGSGVATPIVVAVGTPDGPLQRPCYVQTWIEGADAASVLPRLGPQENDRYASALGRQVAAVHRIPGPRFAEDCAATTTYPTWQAACLSRIGRLAASIEEKAVLPPAVLYAVADRLKTLTDQLGNGIVPRLTHRDLYLPNTLITGEPAGAALLDWEAAAFYDPVWDFVKLGMWVFEPHPALRAPFMAGYTEFEPLPDGFHERLTLYQGIEYLAAFPYFGSAWPDERMLASFRTLLSGWMDAHGLVGARP
ncbi:aminoglycoside phosphotransferase family protein [Kitasatospora purpeofusca]|uniref:phosphotransferase family protein n=1 Tax=Kitasatospora purpeofusca TaxID=67352 RepID=UPI002E11FEAE|nr:aminoglycoside phosphotransferase family protein [Kitasatospora purpeofusca]